MQLKKSQVRNHSNNLTIKNEIKLEFLSKFLQFLTVSKKAKYKQQLVPQKAIREDLFLPNEKEKSLAETDIDWKELLLKYFFSNSKVPPHEPKVSNSNDANQSIATNQLKTKLLAAQSRIKQLEQTLGANKQKATGSADLKNKLRQLEAENRNLVGLKSKAQQELVSLQHDLDEKVTSLAAANQKIKAQHVQLTQKLVEVGRFDPQTAKTAWIDANRVALQNEIKREFDQIRQHWTKNLTELAQKELLDAMERNAPLVAKNRTLLNFKMDNLSKNSNLKSHIIGKSGQNIQAFEKATGVELIINNRNKNIGISSFNPLKRQIAYHALCELVKKEKFSPSWIEKIVQQCQAKMEQEIVKVGKTTVEQLQLDIDHPRLLYLIGKLKYRSGYGQQVLKHSVEVAHFAGQIAAQLGLDVALARRAGLLHDIGKAVDREQIGNHVEIGIRVAAECGENATVINAIHAHHDAVSCATPYAHIVKMADTLSAARSGARLNSKEDFITRINALETMIKSSFSGIKDVHIYKAGREINVVVDPEQIDDLQACQLSAAIWNKVSDDVKGKGKIVIPGDINITILRTKTFTRVVKS